MSSQERILVVAAHPDDEVLGCGGTIARMARQGHQISIAILGEGITGRQQQRQQTDPAQLEKLHDCARQASDRLGAGDLSIFNLPDNRFDSVPILEVIKIVEQCVDTFKPTVIYTHHPGDLNVDHVITHRAVLTSTRPTAGCCVRRIYAFEVPSSTEWSFQQFQPTFRPNTFIDITDTLETKIEAMELYESESREFPHPRSPQSLRAIAQKWGTTVGCNAAEAFELIRSIE